MFLNVTVANIRKFLVARKSNRERCENKVKGPVRIREEVPDGGETANPDINACLCPMNLEKMEAANLAKVGGGESFAPLQGSRTEDPVTG